MRVYHAGDFRMSRNGHFVRQPVEATLRLTHITSSVRYSDKKFFKLALW